MFKMKRFQKIATTGLAVLLLAACGNGGGKSAATEVTEVDMDTLPEVGDFSETEKLHLSGSFTKGNALDGSWVQERLEDQFNIEIQNTKIDTWNDDEVSIMIASGDLPNAFSFTGQNQTPEDLYNDGLTRAIPREMIEKYAPNYAAVLDEVDNGIGWDMYQHPDHEDQYLALVGYQGHTAGITWTPTLRLDWMENLGMDLPDDLEQLGDSDGYERIYLTKESMTLDELEEILYAFAHDDPDGNGKDDTYGISPWNNDLNWAVSLMGAYGLGVNDNNVLENDQLKLPMVTDAYKDLLIRLADWYEKGIIDPEWTTLTTQTAWDKYETGASGYVPAQSAYLAQEAWTEGRSPQNVIQADPDAKLLVLPPEVGPNGDQGVQAFTPVTLLSESLQISADTTDEQLARYLQVFDLINYGDDGAWANYGIPGEHSDWAGEEGNSALIVRDEYDREEGETGFWAYSFRTYYGDRLTYLTHPVTADLNANYFATPEALKLKIQPYRWDLFNETNIGDVESRYLAQLETIQDEFRMSAINGELDIEKEWESYVENWLNNGGQELIEEYEKAPLVSDLLGGDSESE